MLGLLAGALTVEQAIAAGILDGEPAPLAAILG